MLDSIRHVYLLFINWFSNLSESYSICQTVSCEINRFIHQMLDSGEGVRPLPTARAPVVVCRTAVPLLVLDAEGEGGSWRTRAVCFCASFSSVRLRKRGKHIQCERAISQGFLHSFCSIQLIFHCDGYSSVSNKFLSMLLVGVVLFTFIVNQISTENSGKFEASASRHFFNIYISYQLPVMHEDCCVFLESRNFTMCVG